MNIPIRHFAWTTLVAVAAPLVARAQNMRPEAGYTPSEIWFRSIVVNGFAEGSYSHNFNEPDSDRNSLRVFDFEDHELKLDVFELVAQRPITKPGEIGFRFDAEYGQSIPKVTAASGLFRDVGTGKAEDYDLQQGYVSWIAPVGKGLRFDAGKFVTPLGYEVIEGYDGYNDNQTRSILFGFGIPFTHSGLRASYAFTDEARASVMAVQGWDNWHDNNDAKTFGAQLALTPARDWSVYLTAMGGPERKNNDSDDRMVYGLTSTWKATDSVTLGLEGLYGEEEGASAGGNMATWNGAAGYFRHNFSKTASIALRGETFYDADGTRTGTAQRVQSLTLTPQVFITDQVILR
ncbi:MAG: outer membrane beta-barrel protein, partial [Planctomycetota bacterium]